MPQGDRAGVGLPDRGDYWVPIENEWAKAELILDLRGPQTVWKSLIDSFSVDMASGLTSWEYTKATRLLKSSSILVCEDKVSA